MGEPGWMVCRRLVDVGLRIDLDIRRPESEAALLIPGSISWGASSTTSPLVTSPQRDTHDSHDSIAVVQQSRTRHHSCCPTSHVSGSHGSLTRFVTPGDHEQFRQLPISPIVKTVATEGCSNASVFLAVVTVRPAQLVRRMTSTLDRPLHASSGSP
jgi:hypothetical protein